MVSLHKVIDNERARAVFLELRFESHAKAREALRAAGELVDADERLHASEKVEVEGITGQVDDPEWLADIVRYVHDNEGSWP